MKITAAMLRIIKSDPKPIRIGFQTDFLLFTAFVDCWDVCFGLAFSLEKSIE